MIDTSPYIDRLATVLRSKTMSLDSGCVVWTGYRDKKGYGQLGLGPGTRKLIKAHRAAWLVAYGSLPDLFLCHRCDNPPCVNVAHLFLGTAADNSADANKKGLQICGERIGTSKLTAADVREIRRLAASGETNRSLAVRFGVHWGTVGEIVRREIWRHVL